MFLQKAKIQTIENFRNVSHVHFFRKCPMFLRSTPLKLQDILVIDKSF